MRNSLQVNYPSSNNQSCKMIWIIIPANSPSIRTQHCIYVLPFLVIFKQTHKHQPTFLVEIDSPPVSTLVVTNKGYVHITTSMRTLNDKSFSIMLQLKPNKSLTQVSWLHFSNACPPILLQELSEDFFYRKEVERITRQRRDRCDCQVIIPWPRPSPYHNSNHHRPVGDVFNVHPTRLERERISMLERHGLGLL